MHRTVTFSSFDAAHAPVVRSMQARVTSGACNELGSDFDCACCVRPCLCAATRPLYPFLQ